MDFTTVIMYLKDLFATIMVLLMMLSPAFEGNGVAYQAERPDELITSFAVVSDIHVETNNPKVYEKLSDVLYGIKAGEDISTVVYTGDNVMNGQVLEDVFFYTAVASMKPAENNIVVAGNHDFGNGDGDYEQLRKKYIFDNNFYLNNKIDREYYYKVIDGCYMIVLASEHGSPDNFSISQDQLDWLEGVLKQAQAEDAPIFVLAHFPVYTIKDHDYRTLAQLLAKYDTDLYLHGHYHNELKPSSFYNWHGVDCINVPRCTEVVDYEPGDGLVVEVYEDEVVVRGRDFIKGEWIDGMRYTYDIG